MIQLTRIAILVLTFLGAVISQDTPPEPWSSKYGSLPDQPFSGITGFSRLPHIHCLDIPGRSFDIAVLGMPYDSSVSYRPGARFGPQAIRAGSRRHSPMRSFRIPWGFSALQSGLDIVDCNDIPISPYDPTLALSQITTAYSTLLARPITPSNPNTFTSHLSLDGKERPRILSLGGDHTIVLPILESLYAVYGEIAVLHFDAHLDTWSGLDLPGATTPTSQVTHGTFFWKASQLGYISNTSSIHAGIRCRLSGTTASDLSHSKAIGFQTLTTDDIDLLGTRGIADVIKERTGGKAVYLSFDVDTIDPSMAPGTGTPESGGWTTREVRQIIRSLAGLNIVGADIVEVAPAYDHAEITAIAAADLAQEIIALMVSPMYEGMGPAAKGGELKGPAKRKTGDREEVREEGVHDEL